MSRTKRSCDGCTSCCTGTLTVEAFGQKAFPGRPCVALMPGSGCTRYSERPDTCVKFRCGWLDDDTIPAWMKPSLSKAIIRFGELNSHPYVELIEEIPHQITARTLSWFITWGIGKRGNIRWQAEGGWNYMGHPDFVNSCAETLTTEFN